MMKEEEHGWQSDKILMTRLKKENDQRDVRNVCNGEMQISRDVNNDE